MFPVWSIDPLSHLRRYQTTLSCPLPRYGAPLDFGMGRIPNNPRFSPLPLLMHSAESSRLALSTTPDFDLDPRGAGKP
jgi:hypothetical protein